MTRTYGTYQFIPISQTVATVHRTELGMRGGVWKLTLEPAVRARAKRVLARVQQSRSDHITVAHTLEVARDLTWFMERFPLEAADERSQVLLETSTLEHQSREEHIGRILAGGAHLDLPDDVRLTKTPRAYQLEALELVRTRGRILLGDAVGLGKTFTSLLVTTIPDALPAVVVPPTHLPPRWVSELEDAFPDLTFEVAKKTIPPDHVWDGAPANVTIVPYSKLHGWADALGPYVRTVIFDEAQELRHGVGTVKGTAAAQLTEKAAYVIGATATPVYNYGSEIWNITDILSPGELGTRDEFLREWGGMTLSNNRAIVKDPHALGSYLRESGYLLVRTREDVGRELPKTIKHTMTVDFDDTALEEVRGDVEQLAKLILADDTDRQDRFQAAGDIDWMIRQATGVGKARFVAEFCKLLLESEPKIIIWGWHREVYETLMRELRHYNPRLYTGTESPKQKADAERAFTTPPLDPNDPDVTQDQLDKECRVLIMSLRSGAGVDGLQKVASVGVFAELDWSPQVHEQAIGRIRRDGMNETTPPVAYFLVSQEGSDPALMQVLGLKRQQSEALMTRDGQLFNNATNDPARARRLARTILGLPDETDTP